MRKLLLLAALLVTTEAVQAQVVINEFRVRGPSGGNDEFIELFNSGATAVDISGWKINGSNNAGTSVSTRLTVSAGTILQPGGYYLVANNGANGYSGSATPNQVYGTGITDFGGIQLVNASDAIIDQVGLCDALSQDPVAPDCPATGSAYVEGTPVSSKGNSSATANNDLTFNRTAGIDTGNNVADFTLSAASPLPVELASFTATTSGTSALLRWTTESETNNAGFTVEQQNGHWNWVDAGTVTGRGTTAERSTYQHTVSGLVAGTYRFRLRQTDFDGTTSYSPVVEVVVGLDAPMRLAVSGRTVRLAVQQAQPVEAGLYNALGQRMATLFAGEMNGGQTYTVSVTQDLPAGVYFVRVAGATERQTARLVVAR